MTRLDIKKTYKLYIGGQFPRTESGRYYEVSDAKGNFLANACLGSRKDFRNAVVAARKAQSGWAGRSAYNRGQILYRIGEMLEGRKAQFASELEQLGQSKKQANAEVENSIDRLIYYAGWCDKYQQVLSAVNPVSSAHFNFSVAEAMGVVAIIAPETQGLLGLVSTVVPALVSGNTCIVLASKSQALAAVSLAEVLHTSDLPGGVVNILTGDLGELYGHMASHMDVNALIYCGAEDAIEQEIKEKAADNLKRVILYKKKDWSDPNNASPYFIEKTVEIKTNWHPTVI